MFIHDTAVSKDCIFQGDIKLFRNVVVSNSKFGNGCSVGDDTTVERCTLESNVTINRRSYINDSFIGRFSYTGINTTMNWTKLGRFCSLARNVDVGGFDHDYHKFTTMPEFRFRQIAQGGGCIPKPEVHNDYCEIANDVWIAAGAVVLHKVKIGDGAVVGAGAIVTKNVPPYAIVVGAPAKIIGYRCNERCIERLLKLKWWDLEANDLIEIAPNLIHKDISEDNLNRLEDMILEIKGGKQ